MPSPLTIITNALLDLGVNGAAQSSPNGEDTDLGLTHYNRMISYLAAMGLGWYEVNEAFTFSASQQSYTIGPSGGSPNFTMTAGGVRPPKFSRAKLVLTSGSPDSEYDLPIYTVQLYEDIVQPAQSAALPEVVYYQPTVPNGTLWPVPYPTTTTNQIRLFWKSQLASVAIAAISTSIDMPPGWEDALTWDLLQRLSSAFRRPLTEYQILMANASWNVLLTTKNADPAYISTDIAGAEQKTAQTFNPNTLRSYQ